MLNLFQQRVATVFSELFRIKAAILFLALLVSVPMLRAADDFLDPEVAFKFSAKMLDAKTAEVSGDSASEEATL